MSDLHLLTNYSALIYMLEDSQDLSLSLSLHIHTHIYVYTNSLDLSLYHYWSRHVDELKSFGWGKSKRRNIIIMGVSKTSSCHCIIISCIFFTFIKYILCNMGFSLFFYGDTIFFMVYGVANEGHMVFVDSDIKNGDRIGVWASIRLPSRRIRHLRWRIWID